MPKSIVSLRLTKNNPPRQPMLPAFLSQQVDACLWLTETTTDPIVAAFARIALRRLEAQIPTEAAP